MVFGFGKKSVGAPTKSGLELNFTTLLILMILSLVMIQAFGFILGPVLGIEVFLGPAFILIAVSMSASLSIAVFKKMISNQQVTKQDIFAIVVVALLTVLLLFFLRDFVPEIFEQSIVSLQSMVGF